MKVVTGRVEVPQNRSLDRELRYSSFDIPVKQKRDFSRREGFACFQKAPSATRRTHMKHPPKCPHNGAERPAPPYTGAGAGRTAGAVAIGEAAAAGVRRWSRPLAQKLAGRTFQPVRRQSYDVHDRRAQVFRPIADGTPAGALRWSDKLVQTAQEYDDSRKAFGSRMGPLGDSAIRILDVLLRRCCDFATGRCEPSIETLMRYTRYARATVVDALARLRHHGFLSWVRRTRYREDTGEDGPQVAQMSNAYHFDLVRLIPKVKARFQQLLGGRRGAQEARRQREAEAAHQRKLEALRPSQLGSALIEERDEPESEAPSPSPQASPSASEEPSSLNGASSVTGLNPPSPSKR